ncbi:MAG: SoxR reducing system RseC family protein [Bacteroidales bacterium]|nr:SoxR reducing system RseC family protein [Bacteroidales bacterium]HQB85771.1 SoxR reducing system RseC family protein [Bacteroidales bacterium]
MAFARRTDDQMEEPVKKNRIQHDGMVKEVGTDSVIVSIVSCAACAGCKARGFCGMTESEEKTIDIRGRYNVSPGDKVTVQMEESTGMKAVVLSYLVPVLIIMGGLFVLQSLPVNELFAGLISIALLVPWFLILYLSRKKIERSFTFTLKT